MFNENLMKIYKSIKNVDDIMIDLFCLNCTINSLRFYNENKKYDDKLILEIARAVYNTYLDTDIQISTLSDILVENWESYKTDKDFNIYDYIEK
jgi:hypothetical protein